MPSAEKVKTTSGGSKMVEDFQRYFDVSLATTEELRRQTYQIRYRVYCEEFEYEPASHFPDGNETDEYDDRSVHCLVTHKATGTPAGCLRLVCVSGDELTPMESFCSQAVDSDFLNSLEFPRESYCEVSRLAVDGEFRRRSGERMSRFGGNIALDCSKREQRTFSLIAISVLLAGFAAGELIGRKNFLCMMEPFLPRMLKRSGIKVMSVGEETDYHGRRSPYLGKLDEILGGLSPELRELYDEIFRHFEAQLPDMEWGSLAAEMAPKIYTGPSLVKRQSYSDVNVQDIFLTQLAALWHPHKLRYV